LCDHKADISSFNIDRDLRVCEHTEKNHILEAKRSESNAHARVAILDLQNEGGFQKVISQDSRPALRSHHSVLRSGSTLVSAEPSALSLAALSTLT
jgi:hypothetical protein